VPFNTAVAITTITTSHAAGPRLVSILLSCSAKREAAADVNQCMTSHADVIQGKKALIIGYQRKHAKMSGW
jgi:hypothetical protein